MTDLERVIYDAMVSWFGDWSSDSECGRVEEAVRAHVKKDTAREADWESRADFFNRTYKLLDEKEAELTALQKAVRTEADKALKDYAIDMKKSPEPYKALDRLRQLVEEEE